MVGFILYLIANDFKEYRMESASYPVAHPQVVQHNALVNARFDLNTNESRLFLALLARVQRNDKAFSKCRIAVREIMTTSSNSVYDQVRRMLKEFAGRTLIIEQLGPDGRPVKKPNFTVIPLLAYATYIEGEGLIDAQFNDLLLPYLLELRDNFTKAQLTELLKLKSANSYRIYWLLREYAAFGKRTIKLEELKSILGLNQEYDRFNNFRARVLERAKAELAETDLPFTYETIKQGREVTEIKFLFKPASSAVVTLPSDIPEWQVALLGIGVSAVSLPVVQSRLDAGDYDEGYIKYVIDAVRSQVKAGKV
jgi:plasmid replication initiation protein